MVVIVGRPNTGKSTLFNRLVGGRVAITLQEPGITRDRISREVEWLGRHFRVTDTGGLIPGSKEEIAREVERQVRIALDEAKVIILLCDGSAGLLPMDEEIASRFRGEDRRFLVAVNKSDRRGFDPSEFHKLGADALVPISAERGTGVDDLLDEILKRLPEAGRPRRRTPLSLAILGRPNVGKSSFMNRVLGHERAIVTPTPGTTRDVVEETFEREGRHFRLLDTAGIRRKPRVKEAVEYYSVTRAIDQIARCDVALVMFDAFDGPNNQDKRIANLVIERHKGMVIIANKMDRVPPDLKDKVNEWMKQELEFCRWAPLVRASVINGVGIDAALAKAASVWDRGGQAVRNSELRAALMPRLVGNPPRHDTRVLALSQTGTRPPAFRLRLSNPKAMTPSYEKFLVAEIRKRFRFPGYPILLHVTR